MPHPPLFDTSPAWAAYRVAEALPAPIIGDPALPLISIVTPSLNQGSYLAEAITSVLGQDYPNIEYWVIDGGSSDKSLDVLKASADPRLSWISAADRGQSDAINRGWARCRGEIVAWLNSDDTYLPGAIRRQVAALQSNPTAGAVYADAQYTDTRGQALTRLYGRPYSPLALLRLELPPQPTVFLRRELVAQAGPLDLSRRYSMDTDYWVRIARLAPLHYAPGLVATYRLHSASKTVGQFAGFYVEWLEIARHFFAQEGLPAELRAARGPVIADIYAAMANLEAARGSPAAALRYLAFAIAVGGMRPRMLKLPLALSERYLPLSLAARASELWGRWRSQP